MRNVLLAILLLSSVYTYSQNLDKPTKRTTLHKAKVSNSVQNNEKNILLKREKEQYRVTEEEPYKPYYYHMDKYQNVGKELDSLYAEFVSNNTKIEEALRIIYGRYGGDIGRVFFASNKTNISSSSTIVLDSWAKFLLYYQNIEFFICGHTDNSLSQQKALRLSEDRANAVKFYLLAKGVNENQLNIKAYGSEQPIASNLTSKGRRLNNRVEITWKKQ
jgi:ompA family protein